VPAYIWPNVPPNQTKDTLNRSLYSYPNYLIMPGSTGTNWWKAVFSPASVTDAFLSVAGGGEDNAYRVSFNWFKQNGTAAYNQYQRGTLRINTAFNLGKVSVGENIGLALEQSFGGIPNDDQGEGSILGKNILSQPVVPIYDIGGHFASGKAVGLGNNTNPLGFAYNHQYDRSNNGRIFGNVFGGVDILRNLSVKTRFGFNVGGSTFKGFTPITPENAEVNLTNGINQAFGQFAEWTWSNTVNYVNAFGRHNLAVLAGQEANKNNNASLVGSIGDLRNTDPASRYIQDPLSATPTTKNVSSGGDVGTLLSFFGKADYNFAERYYLSLTVRRDGSSRFAETNRWGTFPAIGAGWRLSQESFFPQGEVVTNAMLRAGWGITGNQNIPTGRVVNLFGGGSGDTFYDITGSGTTLVPGFRQVSLGNPDLKWEENKSVNLGLDLELWRGKGNFSLDVYNRETSNLLFPPALPATAGTGSPPFVNIGKMRNRGYEFSLGYTGTLGEGKLWNATFTGSHYENRILQIDGVAKFFFGPVVTREQNAVINQVGYPIGSFYGLVANGFYRDSADAAPYYADGARPGRIKFLDANGDGKITQADRQVIGNPHPDFTAGLDLGLHWGAWDLSATLFGTFGNQIFNYQKYWYVFRVFNTNVRNDMVTNSWTPTNQNAKYPRLDVSDSWSNTLSSYYIEDGSYVRLRNLQIAYTVPPGLVSWIPAARIYVQAENLFTITGYSGLDPALPVQNVFGAAGDIRDQYRGVDRGTYPSNKTISVGISTTF
jgi:TonB-linked SusC/RagA family outer membrane protein